jgi:hypothetical protein
MLFIQFEYQARNFEQNVHNDDNQQSKMHR